MYEYHDGNGNRYIIKSEIIEYIPVKPPKSSSGIYNGGHYVKKKTSKSQYETLLSLFNQAIKNKACHIKNRVKTSGMIVFQKEKERKRYIINTKSQEKKEIEKILRIIIEN